MGDPLLRKLYVDIRMYVCGELNVRGKGLGKWIFRNTKNSLLLYAGVDRWQLNEDAMATEKLAEGIRNFAADIEKLEAIIRPLLQAKC